MRKIQFDQTFYALLAYGSQIGFGFLSFLVLVRYLPKSIFGWWVLLVTFTTIADMARIGLIQNGMIRYLKQAPQERKSIVGSAMILSLLASMCLGILVMVCCWAYQLETEGTSLLQFSLVYVALIIVQGMLRLKESLYMECEAFEKLFIAKCAYGAIFVLGIFVLPGLSLFHLICWQLLVTSIVLGGILMRQKFSFEFKKIHIKALIDYGRFTMGTNLGSMIFNKMDVLILGAFLGPSSVGFYNVAARLTNIVEIPLTAKAQVLFPALANCQAKQKWQKLQELYEQGLAQVLGLLLPICLLLFFLAKPIVLLVAGPGYGEAASVLQILTVVVFLKPWGRFFGITVDAIGKPRLNFYLLLFWMVFNVVLNILFIPIWGIYGVAYATLLTTFCGMLVSQIYLHKILRIQPMNVLKYWMNLYYNFFTPKQLKSSWR